MALFSAGASSGTRETSKNLVEFRAGKLNLKGTRVIPDKRKGLFYIHREKETMLTHVCWKDRNTGNVEDDLIVFPDDCEWKKVTQCTTGRVYLLKFVSTNKKLFFWMQEPKDTKDEEFSKKINKVLNDPDDGGDSLAGMGGSSTEQLLAQMLGGGGGSGSQHEQILQQFLQGSGLASGGSMSSRSSSRAGGGAQSARATESTAQVQPSASSRPVSSNPPAAIQLADFQNIMSSLGAQPKESRPSESVDLSAALPLDLTSLTTPEVRSRLESHLPHDSEVIAESSAELTTSLNSPQFRQALSSFSMAFSSGQLGPVISQFDLGPDAEAAARTGDLKAFVEALNKKAGGGDDKPKDEEEPMQ